LHYNESELQIEEHYTDTHGYTEINLAAFAMLGLRFCPRTRGVPSQAGFLNKDINGNIWHIGA
jgi:TnpA family transposase